MQSELNAVFKKVEQELLEDDMILEYLPKEKIENILKSHHQNILEYLQTGNTNLDFYKKIEIPFIFIHTDFNLIREEILNRAKENIPVDFIKKFLQYKSLIAKTFILKDIEELENILKTPYDENLLFKEHKIFIEKIITSVKNSNLKLFPFYSPLSCNFKNILNYPKSIMVIQNENNLKRINRLHNLIHKSANAFYLSYSKERYTQAYFALKNLKEHIFRFIKVLSELYFETFTNLEEYFFATAKKLHYKKDIYLSIIDIKNLKNFNTIYGERLVNEALKVLYDRLQKFMKSDYQRTITIKANSADFFMLNVNYSKDEFKILLEKIYEVLNQPIKIENVYLNIPVIIGGMRLESSLNLDKDTMLHSLIVLKNRAKKENKEIKIIYTAKEFEEVINEDFNESFIINKLSNKEVDIMFQPIFETKTKEVFSLEVLGRIKEGNKLLPAGMFIDKIYELQLIEEFDSLILDKLIEKEHKIKEITNKIFLNISFQSLLNDKYMQKLKQFLENFGIEVILELTEQKFVSDIELIKNIYDQYQIHFAVDDFGTGYSSLQLVVELVELDILKILKIDGSLIKNLETNQNLRKIIELISKLGKDFKLITVAEFVESQNILNHLKEIGIDLAQGYYLSKPKTIDELLNEKEKFISQKRKNQIYTLVYGKRI